MVGRAPLTIRRQSWAPLKTGPRDRYVGLRRSPEMRELRSAMEKFHAETYQRMWQVAVTLNAAASRLVALS
jgi:hypothetical protein